MLLLAFCWRKYQVYSEASPYQQLQRRSNPESVYTATAVPHMNRDHEKRESVKGRHMDQDTEHIPVKKGQETPKP